MDVIGKRLNWVFLKNLLDANSIDGKVEEVFSVFSLRQTDKASRRKVLLLQNLLFAGEWYIKTEFISTGLSRA